jgi:hypothetical protein
MPHSLPAHSHDSRPPHPPPFPTPYTHRLHLTHAPPTHRPSPPPTPTASAGTPAPSRAARRASTRAGPRPSPRCCWPSTPTHRSDKPAVLAPPPPPACLPARRPRRLHPPCPPFTPPPSHLYVQLASLDPEDVECIREAAGRAGELLQARMAPGSPERGQYGALCRMAVGP